jgi:hypothetical protein
MQSLRVHGVPDKLERTAWDSRSGGDRVLISAAFKFFGLTDDLGNPQPILKKLADAGDNTEQEKTILKALIEYAYHEVFKLNLKTATMGLITEAIGKMGVTGATRLRSVRFFIKAAHYSGIELSSRLTSKLRARAEGDSGRSDAGDESSSDNTRSRRPKKRPADLSATGVAVKTITLRNMSGDLTLSGTFNPFDLSGDERKLIYGMIDLMKNYESGEG